MHRCEAIAAALCTTKIDVILELVLGSWIV